MIYIVDWTVVAIGEHIATEDALAGGRVRISTDKPTPYGVIVAALQVIEACF